MARITTTLRTPDEQLFTGEVTFKPSPNLLQLHGGHTVSAAPITCAVACGALDQVLDGGNYLFIAPWTKPVRIAVPETDATMELQTLVVSGAAQLPEVAFEVGMPPGGVPGEALIRMGAGDFGTIWGAGIQPRIEWYGGVADMQIDAEGHITGTDNTAAMRACLLAHGKCFFKGGARYALSFGPYLNTISPIYNGSVQAFIGSDSDTMAEIGFLDGTLAPYNDAAPGQIALPWWTAGTWSSDYLFVCTGQNSRGIVTRGIKWYPNQKWRPCKYATTTRTFIRLGTVYCYFYGQAHVLDNLEIVSPGVHRGNAPGMPETFVVFCTRWPHIGVSGQWDVAQAPFTWPAVDQTVTVRTTNPFYSVGDIVLFQKLGSAEVMSITPVGAEYDVTFKSVSYLEERGLPSPSDDPIEVTIDVPIIRHGIGEDWTFHDGYWMRNIRFTGPVPEAPESDFDVPRSVTRGPELTLVGFNCEGYKRHLVQGSIIENIHFQGLRNSENFPRAIHGVTVAGSYDTIIRNITGDDYSGCLWYCDAWINLGLKISGLRGARIGAGLRGNMGSYGFVGSEVDTGRATPSSPFRVSPWWEIEITDSDYTSTQLGPAESEAADVWYADSDNERPAWGNAAHFNRLTYNGNRCESIGGAPPMQFIFGDGYALGDLEFTENTFAFWADDYLVEGPLTVTGIASGLRFCRRIIWTGNRTPTGEPVGVWHNLESAGLVPEVLYGQTPQLSDNRSRIGSATPDANGRVKLHLTKDWDARIPLQEVTRWTGVAARLLLPRVSSSRRWFAGATMPTPNNPTEFHIFPGTEVTILNDGTGTLTIEEWSKGDPNVETELTTIPVGAVKTFVSSGSKENGHWLLT